MANYINITDKDDNHLGSMALPLSCYAVLKKLVIEKYNPEYSEMDSDINKQLEPVYDKCEPHEEAMILLFLNDVSNFDESDIEKFDKLIDTFPDDINQTPKQALINFRDFLEQHKYLKTSYSHATSTVVISDS